MDAISRLEAMQRGGAAGGGKQPSPSGSSGVIDEFSPSRSVGADGAGGAAGEAPSRPTTREREWQQRVRKMESNGSATGVDPQFGPANQPEERDSNELALALISPEDSSRPQSRVRWGIFP